MVRKILRVGIQDIAVYHKIEGTMGQLEIMMVKQNKPDLGRQSTLSPLGSDCWGIGRGKCKRAGGNSPLLHVWKCHYAIPYCIELNAKNILANSNHL